MQRIRPLYRSIHTSARAQAAPAPARAPYVRRTAVPVSAASRSVSASRPAVSTPTPVFDFPDVDDIPSPVSEIEDYANLAPSRSPNSSVEPSPPLAAFPNDSYKSLPTAPTTIAGEVYTDWTTSFSGLSQTPFSKEAAAELMKPLDPEDIEIKPDGLLYLPEIKYRRTLNLAFGPGGWGLAPRGETNVSEKIVSREWGLVCLGRLVSVARGEQEYFGPHGIPTATEAVKSNALMRCCKDLGIASELWDPKFIREYKEKHCVEVFAEHQMTKKKKKMWRKKNGPKLEYPYKEGK
ncbi:mitochondrial genome maintenance MGM101-domain-containing protein [Naematelia encephala]|uniref:Mitochondrial genome maintenance protein MGM101 n=1 Tax=Naematelia encephala TaxID=71784 RepID=A0A1Y2BF76_9TREE|nr:mitochondrial genome maintenance MGM101-domain-containing protein [Naematelia encephala]